MARSKKIEAVSETFSPAFLTEVMKATEVPADQPITTTVGEEKAVDAQADQHLADSPAGVNQPVPEGAGKTLETETVEQAKVRQELADTAAWEASKAMSDGDRTTHVASVIIDLRSAHAKVDDLGGKFLVLVGNCKSADHAKEILLAAIATLPVFKGIAKTGKGTVSTVDKTVTQYRSQISIGFEHGILPSVKPLKISELIRLNREAKAKEDNAATGRAHGAIDRVVQQDRIAAEKAAAPAGTKVDETIHESDKLLKLAMANRRALIDVLMSMPPAIEMTFYMDPNMQKAFSAMRSLHAKALAAVRGDAPKADAA